MTSPRSELTAALFGELTSVGRCVSASVAQTEALGEELGGWLASRPVGQRVLLLEGEMGAGKTVLVRGMASVLGVEPASIQSPTFTLINEYRSVEGAVALVHCDLYRLEPNEVAATGILDSVDEAVPLVVEWSERLPTDWPGAARLRLSRPHAVDPGPDSERAEQGMRQVEWLPSKNSGS